MNASPTTLDTIQDTLRTETEMQLALIEMAYAGVIPRAILEAEA